MKMKDFGDEDEGFLAKMKDFLVKITDFFFFFIFAKNTSSLPMFTLHTNEWSACTEHMQT